MQRLIVLTSILWITNSASAQSQSHIDEAKKLLDLMNSDQSIEQAYEQIFAQTSNMAEQMGITEEQRPTFDRYMEKMVVVMKEELNWQKMEPYMIDAYVSVYSEEELAELNEFYASPLGQKFVAKMPELMQATLEMTQKMMRDVIPRMREIQKELQLEIQREQQESR